MAIAAKILIVDDDLEIRQLLGEQLRDLGHESIYAGDGEQALSAARSERPDLILLDLVLPAPGGFEVLERLQQIPDVADTPVIVFSGIRSPDAERRALSLGAREYVRKSFDGHGLSEALARVVGRGPAHDPLQSPLYLKPPPLSAGAPPDQAVAIPALRAPTAMPVQSYGE
jgi:CheY-like chemotaxis protein